ncbi:hypothetical protein KCP73_24170 [Salmonella enterica subsp. enterica]|nr:hypothetical protein KCP73_24170 [Salmonella enterica subsp. enterica]
MLPRACRRYLSNFPAGWNRAGVIRKPKKVMQAIEAGIERQTENRRRRLLLKTARRRVP